MFSLALSKKSYDPRRTAEDEKVVLVSFTLPHITISELGFGPKDCNVSFFPFIKMLTWVTFHDSTETMSKTEKPSLAIRLLGINITNLLLYAYQ